MGSRTVATTIGVVTALAASFAAGAVLTGPDGGGQTGPGPARVAAGPGTLSAAAYADADLAPADCEGLLDHYVREGVRRVTAWGWESPYLYATADFGSVPQSGALDSVELSAERAATAAMPAPSRATSNETGTNVQEVGVDEPDVVKTDGSLLARVQDRDLVLYDVSGDPERLGSLELQGMREPELLLTGDRVVVLGRYTDEDHVPLTRTLVVDVSDPERPTVVDDATYDTELVTARLHGGTLRLVVAANLPDLDFVEPRRWLRGQDSARDHNQDVVRESTIEDWLPTVTRDGGTEPLLECDDVALPDDDSRLGTLAVVGVDPTDPGEWEASAVATDSRTVYFSTDRMVLATGGATGWWGGPAVDVCCLRPMVPEASGTSHLYSFALDGLTTTYLASGRVDGAIQDRWSMDEADGVLRVAVGPTNETGDFNSVVTLEEEGDDLVELGRVDKLGVNETIRSVRWFDEMAFVVTFREVDPLYAVDLTDPAEPGLIGKLKVPGFSEYLHPLGRHRLLGIGQGPGERGHWGAQAGLFSVTDLTDLRRLDVHSFRGGSQAGVAADPRQFTWLQDGRTALTVISRGWQGRTGWVAVLEIGDGRIENRMVEVEYGDDVDDVRTVPLADGRVLLVTGEDVSRLRL